MNDIMKSRNYSMISADCLTKYPRMNSPVCPKIGHLSVMLIAVLGKHGGNSTSVVFDDNNDNNNYNQEDYLALAERAAP
jgi:hypothetical protein